VAPVPQGERETDAPLAVADPQQAVLSPAVGAAAGMVVGEVIPGVAAGRVILAHGPPLPLGKIGPPTLPVLLAPGILLETEGLGIGGRFRGQHGESLPRDGCGSITGDKTARDMGTRAQAAGDVGEAWRARAEGRPSVVAAVIGARRGHVHRR